MTERRDHLLARLTRIKQGVQDRVAMSAYQLRRVNDGSTAVVSKGGKTIFEQGKSFVIAARQARRRINARFGNREKMTIDDRLKPVKDNLAKIPHKNIRSFLGAQAERTGLSRVSTPLTGILDYASEIKIDGIRYHMFAVRILPQTDKRPPPTPRHNRNAAEVYRVVKGYGILQIGRMDDGQITWTRRQPIWSGRTYTTYPGEVHVIINEGRNPVDVIHAMPDPSLVPARR